MQLQSHPLASHRTPAHPAAAVERPLRASSPPFGPDFGRVRGIRRKGMGAPATVQLKSLKFPRSMKTEPFWSPFLTAVPPLVLLLSPPCSRRHDSHYRRIAALFPLTAILCSLVGSLGVCGVFRPHDWLTTGKIPLHDSPRTGDGRWLRSESKQRLLSKSHAISDTGTVRTQCSSRCFYCKHGRRAGRRPPGYYR